MNIPRHVHPSFQLAALAIAIFISLTVLVLDASYIGVTYDLVSKMNNFVYQHDISKQLLSVFQIDLEVFTWLMMLPAGISGIVAMAWLIVPKIRESRVIQASLAATMFAFWFIVIVWTLVQVQGFVSPYYCDDTTRDLGCFDDQAFQYSGWAEELNPEYNFNSSSMTVDLCRSTCSDQFDFYAAVQGSYCSCLMWFDASFNVSSSSCNSACPGNSKQMCGGGNSSVSVWVSKAVGDDTASQCFLYSTATALSLVAVVVWLLLIVLAFISAEPAKVPFFKYPSPSRNGAVAAEGGAKHDKNWAQLDDE